MPKTADTFAARLAAARTRAGLSVAALADRAGLHRDTLHKLERGDRQPSLAVAQALARALGVELQTLSP